jgi:hypothetical protein
LPLFLKFVEDQGQYFIDSVDDWLASKKVAHSARCVSVPVGTGAFAWAGHAYRDVKRESKRVREAAPKTARPPQV